MSRIVLGTQLRRLREEAGITREAAGNAIRASHAKISRLELGRVGFKERDVLDLLALYGITDEEQRAAVMDLMRQANTRGWWQQHSDVLPTWFENYLRLEQVAKVIRTYQVQFVPGLIQNEEYARAVIQHGHRARTDYEIERRVQLRMDRQKMLHQPDAPHLWAVIDEAALTRPFGPPRVMRAQMKHLLDVSYGAEHRRPGPAVPQRRARGGGRVVHDPAVRRAGPARRRLPRAAHQRGLPRQALRRRGLRDDHGADQRAGRDPDAVAGDAASPAQRDLSAFPG